MDILELIKNAEDIYANKYYVGFVKGIIVDNSILLKYKYPRMFSEKVAITIEPDNDISITILDWFKDDMSKDIANKLMNYFKLLGYKVNMK
jgi:hypothetical protein